jgi:hypothetical protein
MSMPNQNGSLQLCFGTAIARYMQSHICVLGLSIGTDTQQ